MIDKLIEGKLVTLLVGSVFRLIEILVRTVHITVRGLRILVQETVTARIDRGISRIGKRMVAARTPVDPSSVVLIEKRGEYTGDAKYIAEEILRRGTDVTITWALREQSVGPFPREFRFVRYGTAGFFRAVAAAAVVVDDSGALQRSGGVKGPSQHWLRMADGSVDGALGHPRNDILLDTPATVTDQVRKKVLARLGVTDTGQRFLLYAPERTGDTGAAPLSGIDVASVRAGLAARFGGTWEFLVRTQEPGKAQSDILLAGLPAYCRNASFHPDLQELLVVADAAMTDAAEWIDDFRLTRRPGFLVSVRPQATARVATAFTVATSNRELLDDIAGFDPQEYDRRVEQFLASRGSVDDGAAAARTVDEIERLRTP